MPFTIDDIAAMAQGALRGLLKRDDLAIDTLTRERLQVVADMQPDGPSVSAAIEHGWASKSEIRKAQDFTQAEESIEQRQQLASLFAAAADHGVGTALPEIVEHIGDDFGVTVIYTLNPEYLSSVTFQAVEITALSMENDRLYTKKGGADSMDHTSDPHEAERLVGGSVKWDGYSHLWFGDEDGYLYLNGTGGLETILPAIYERCGELMQARGVFLDEGAFKCRP